MQENAGLDIFRGLENPRSFFSQDFGIDFNWLASGPYQTTRSIVLVPNLNISYPWVNMMSFPFHNQQRIHMHTTPLTEIGIELIDLHWLNQTSAGDLCAHYPGRQILE